ncbi:MAG: hypothetical protein Tsb0013_18460 [Phycisphaerales bacterium]
MSFSTHDIAPGMRVRVTQTIQFGRAQTTTAVEGEVLRVGQQKTGSWFAHGKDDKLWLDRVELRKHDGELVKINLDKRTEVEILGESAA